MDADSHRLHARGVAALNRGDAAAAAELLRAAIAARGDVSGYHNNLGLACRTLGRLEEAEAALRRAIELEPERVDAHANLLAVLCDLGRYEEAGTLGRQWHARWPDDPALANNTATAMRTGGGYGEARRVLETVLRAHPDRWELHVNLGTLFETVGMQVEAAAALARAVAIEGVDGAVFLHLAQLLRDLKRRDEAETVLRAAVNADPTDAVAWQALGEVLRERLDWDGAIAAWHRAARLDPDSPDAHFSLGSAMAALGIATEAVAHLRRARDRMPDSPRVHSNLLIALQYAPGIPRADIATEHRLWGERFGRPHGPRSARRAGARLRVGFVSSGFRFHATAFFLLPMLQARPAGAWDAVAFANLAPSAADTYTRAFIDAFDEWRWSAHLCDDDLANAVRTAGIDILIDLNGHTRGNRLTAFTRRPAPIQASWMDYVDTTGSSAFDWLIADATHVPPADEAHYVERIARMPRDYICYGPPADAPDPADAPPAARNGVVTFGCFNTARKISPRAILLWARILAAVPGSRLLLNSHEYQWAEVRDRLRVLFAEAGIGADRIEFAKGGEHAAFLGRYRDVDIALDPFPYSGGLNTCEALWMGVPVVTMRGNRFCGRHAACHLTNAGLPELVTESEDAYAETAVRLATDAGALAALRAGLRARVAASPLTDAAGFAEDFTALLHDLATADLSNSA